MTINRAPAAAVIIAAGIFTPAHAQLAQTAKPVSLTTPAPLARALATVDVTGSTVYGQARLFAAYRDQLGAPASRAGALAIAQALADLYVTDGYVKPEVNVDDSQGGRGMLRVAVHEARITQVVWDGDTGRAGAELGRIAARLENARPLRRDDVPRALREMRAIAGLAVTATTRRDAHVRNGFELVVKPDYSAVDGVVRMNNRGTDQVGPAFLLGQVFANGLLGGREKLGLIFASAVDPEEYLGAGLYLDAPLGDGGTRANALLFRSTSAPNEAPVNLDHEYTRERATFKVARPLATGAFTLTLGGGFEADDLIIHRAGTSIREDRLRIVETSLRGGWRVKSAQFSTTLLARRGLDGAGAGFQAADLAHDARRVDFLVTQLQATAAQRFATAWSWRADLFAQHTGYVLPDSERFKIGGDRLGRGFEVAEIAGDRGLGGKLELRRELVNTESFAGRVSTYGFYDIGAAWKQDRPGRESAATAGVGFGLTGAKLGGYLEVAAPLTGPDIEGKRRASVFAELSYRF